MSQAVDIRTGVYLVLSDDNNYRLSGYCVMRNAAYSTEWRSMRKSSNTRFALK